MPLETDPTYQARAQVLELLSKIQSDTVTVGSDWGMPHVAEWAKRVEKLIQDYWL